MFCCRSLCIKDQLEEHLPQLLQIESGLAKCDLLTHIRNNPKVWQPVFETGNMFKVSSGEILDDSVVEFSESQILKEFEIDTHKYFSDALESMDHGGKGFCSNAIFFQCNFSHGSIL